jgi:arsenate reductase
MDRVVFACRHNAGRSQMAASFFRLLADPSLAEAISAGTTPGEHVHPEVAQVMAEVGVDLSQAKPQRLTADLARGARLLITMGCNEECPYVPGVEIRDWALQDPKGQSLDRVREIRDDIRGRVAALIRESGWGPAGDR